MTSVVHPGTHWLDRFIQASAAYLIPSACLFANLAAYLNKDDIKPYEILGLNVFANLVLLWAYLRGDRAAPSARCGDARRRDAASS
ncbi:hypothetical protein ACHAP8_004725 [Fusarium lateritium]